jgi:hypothetical protein
MAMDWHTGNNPWASDKETLSLGSPFDQLDQEEDEGEDGPSP